MLPGGALHIFRVRGRATGKGIYFPDIGIKNGINFHNFGTRNGTYFRDFYMKYKRSDILFRKIGIRSGILFQKLVYGTGMFLKPQWHVPYQNLVKCTPLDRAARSSIIFYLLAFLTTLIFNNQKVWLQPRHFR